MIFSIVVPTYEMNGYGVNHLRKLLKSISNQTIKSYEVIISDHSKDDRIEKFVKSYTLKKDIKIRYTRFEDKRGNSSANMNNGIKMATGEVIKIMHMDDYFFSKDALKIIAKYIKENPNRKWGAVGFNHFYTYFLFLGKVKNKKVPSFLPFTRILTGNPSTNFFVNNSFDKDFFDENFIYVNDQQFNEYLFFKYGYPLIINEECVTITKTSYRVTDKLSDEYKNKEEIILEKHREKIFSKMSLTQIANYYGTDKGTVPPDDGNYHGPRLKFTTEYEKFFEPLRNIEIKLLEIGIGSGESLKMWETYFISATISAFDIIENRKFDSDRTKTYLCDQGNAESLLNAVSKITTPIDIIIDDGSHVTKHQILTFLTLFKFLKSGGMYWVEDLHTSDENVWKEGVTLYGYDMGDNKGFMNAVDFFEHLTDYEYLEKHPMINEETLQYLKNSVSSVEMFDLGITSWGKNKLALVKKK